MSDHDAVLFANEAFYLAFSSRDFSAMQSIWAEHAPVTCVHPGWGLLADRREVMLSWQAILANPNSPDVECHNPIVHIYGDVASVICFELVAEASLLATNLFIREEKIWKLVHHQSGAAPPPDEEDWPDETENFMQ